VPKFATECRLYPQSGQNGRTLVRPLCAKSGLMRRSKDRCKVVRLKHHMRRETVAIAHRSRVGSDGIRAVFGSDLALVAATHSGSRPALIESGSKRIGSSSEGRHLKLKLVRRIKAGHMLRDRRLACQSAGKTQKSCRFGVHSENLGYVYFLY